jgi:hypothetical protein
MAQKLGSWTSWFSIAVVGALAPVVHASYFDWSDVDAYLVISALTLACAVKWPRAATAAIAIILVAVIAGRLIPQASGDWPLARQVRVGDTWASVQEKVGSPSYEASTFAAARKLDTGYSTPSPLRFHHPGPVAVFVNGEKALWVFHDTSRVQGVFIGGS